MENQKPSYLIEEIERDLELPPGFCRTILYEKRDWDFIIKIHSLIEAAVTFYLTKEFISSHIEKIDKTLFEKFLASLPTANNTSGKLALLTALGALEEHRGFLKHLSEVRNFFVHNIKNINLSLCDFYELKSNQKTRTTFNNLCENLLKIRITENEAAKDLFNKARLYVFLMTSDLLEKIYNRKNHWLVSHIRNAWENEPFDAQPDFESYYQAVQDNLQILSESGSIKNK